MSIRGNFIGNVSPRTNYNQADPTKADYLDGKPELDKKISAALPKTGGVMTGTLTTTGIVLTKGVDYGDSLPSTVTAGKLFFKRVGGSVNGNGGGDSNNVERYTGDYQVTPTASGKTLETNQKLMVDDVTIQAIPFSSVGNSAGGQTIYIGNVKII